MIFLKSLSTFLCFSCYTNFLKKYYAKSSITQGYSTLYNVLIDLLDTFNFAPHPFESNKIIQRYNREIMFILNELVLGPSNFLIGYKQDKNFYHLKIHLLAWESNIDIQLVFICCKAEAYRCSYFSNGEGICLQTMK